MGFKMCCLAIICWYSNHFLSLQNYCLVFSINYFRRVDFRMRNLLYNDQPDHLKIYLLFIVIAATCLCQHFE